MMEEMPIGFDQPMTPPPASSAAMASSSHTPRVSYGTECDGDSMDAPAIALIPSSRRASSQDSLNFDEEAHEDEEEEEDPDWSGDHEDPDDPEWTGKEELPAAASMTLTPTPKVNKKQ